MTFGDYQFDIYLHGLDGVVPTLPMAYADWEARAQAAMPPSVCSYVAGGAGDERTQRVNVTAFERWGLVPRMFVGAKDRDLSVEMFGMTLPSPVFMAPIGVIGAVRPGRPRRPGHRAGRRPHRCADGCVDGIGRPYGAGGRRIR